MQTQDWKEITKSSYDTHASDFSDHTNIFRGKLEEWIKRFTNQLWPGGLVLDVGSGAGRDAKFFSDCGLRVIGIDLSQQLIDIAQEKVPKASFYKMDFEKMVFQDNKFDGVWAMASLLHAPKVRLLSVFKQIYKILKVDGLFFSTYRVGDEEKFTEEKRGNAILKRFYAYYKPRELKSLLTEAGFRNINYELDTIDSGEWVGFFARK